MWFHVTHMHFRFMASSRRDLTALEEDFVMRYPLLHLHGKEQSMRCVVAQSAFMHSGATHFWQLREIQVRVLSKSTSALECKALPNYGNVLSGSFRNLRLNPSCRLTSQLFVHGISGRMWIYCLQRWTSLGIVFATSFDFADGSVHPSRIRGSMAGWIEYLW